MTELESADNTEIIFSMRFLLIIYFIWVWPFTFFGLCVNEADISAGNAPSFPFLSPIGAEGILELLFFPVATLADLFILLWLLRFCLPQSLKHKLVWEASTAYQQDDVIKNDKLAVCSPFLALLGTVVLSYAKSHIRVDGSRRQPVVTWEGPAAEYFERLLALGWTLSYLAGILGLVSFACFSTRKNWMAIVGAVVGYGNIFGSFVIACAIYED
ncbi:hypothetical protein FYZ48_27000 [Gimesia chilikensis]|uniref:hypothetical protein n=1 Tax=Gimesia chilikensis TaxID=2605989 RepID=UPI0011ED2DE7|nr:hypothetical protein [Gimesia chilikensis]KAA0131782.1 hypothetical protein FYZ48_27000 [Gimesia chilikensis]